LIIMTLVTEHYRNQPCYRRFSVRVFGVLFVCLASQACTTSDKLHLSQNPGVASGASPAGKSAVAPLQSGAPRARTVAAKSGTFNAAAAGGGSGSMRSAVAGALRHSADIKSADARYAEAGMNVSIAKSGYMPTLQSSGGAGSATDYQVSLSQPVYDFGQTGSKVRQASAGADAASFELKATREDIALKAAQSFISIKRYEALVGAARENIGVQERFVTLASTRSQGGISDATEVQLANVHLGEAQSSLEDAEGYLRAARSTYYSYVGSQAGELTDVPELALSMTGPDQFADGVGDAPTVRLASARGDEAQGAADAEKASLYPRLTVETYYRGGSDYTGDKSGIGFRLTGPTMTGLSSFQRAQAMQSAVEASRWNAEAAKRDVALKVRELMDRAPTLRNQIGILGMQQEKAKKLRQFYEDQFKMGERSFLDLITVQNDVTRLERSKINAKYDILDLQYNSAGALGTLLQQLAIKE
jgi:adhesin transport system outer membrane protein